MQTQSWDDRESDQKRYKTIVRAEDWTRARSGRRRPRRWRRRWRICPSHSIGDHLIGHGKAGAFVHENRGAWRWGSKAFKPKISE